MSGKRAIQTFVGGSRDCCGQGLSWSTREETGRKAGVLRIKRVSVERSSSGFGVKQQRSLNLSVIGNIFHRNVPHIDELFNYASIVLSILHYATVKRNQRLTAGRICSTQEGLT